mmetsp:Transcript_1967/g.4331  ORF Transcript_1967/g.4331 Transcript_1967/m.4331 type:complete len:210 (-) Transcript_1967:225-854(-)
MTGQLVFHEATRGAPSLCRGWRTPDPSPTRSCQGLPGCAGAGEWVEEPVSEHPAWQEQLPIHRPGATSLPRPALGMPQVDFTLEGLPGEWEGSLYDNAQTPRHDNLSGFGPSPQTLTVTVEERRDADLLDRAREQTPSPKRRSSRDCSPWSSEEAVPPLPSLGSAGHPETCKGACKYFWKKRGCKDGANCDHCHICEWKRAQPASVRAK